MATYPIPDVDDIRRRIASATGDDPISQLLAALLKTLETLYPTYDPNYIEQVIMGAMLTSLSLGDRPYLPMLDTRLTPLTPTNQEPDPLSKDAALPHLFWGLLYDGWAPDPTSGTTVFVTGYSDRNQPSSASPSPVANLRKRIYATATTPDLMPVYRPTIVSFFKTLLSAENAGKPLMIQYLDSYFQNLYWPLHLGVGGANVPDYAVEIGQAFNTVLAIVTPTEQIVYDNYMAVRNLRAQLTSWIQSQLSQLQNRSTIAYYWLRNSKNGTDPNFRMVDITFECFHDFVALAQWGNMLYNTMKLLDVTNNDPLPTAVRAAFAAAMTAPPDPSQPFDALDRFIMELFRIISPNGASISTLGMPGVTNSPFERYTYLFTPHAPTSELTVHWTNPAAFDPDRYLNSPTASHNNPARSAEIGFATCPFEQEHFSVIDGRNVDVTNSVFGTVYSYVDYKESKIFDYAGYAPFGFGYRRCPGELLNVEVMRDLLQIVWTQKIQFEKLDIPDPQRVPIAPLTYDFDIYGFTTSS